MKHFIQKVAMIGFAITFAWPELVANADEPFFETTCVFPNAPNNKPNYRISAIIQASNRDLLVICEKRNDGIGDIGDHDIAMKRSTDKGSSHYWDELHFARFNMEWLSNSRGSAP